MKINSENSTASPMASRNLNLRILPSEIMIQPLKNEIEDERKIMNTRKKKNANH